MAQVPEGRTILQDPRGVQEGCESRVLLPYFRVNSIVGREKTELEVALTKLKLKTKTATNAMFAMILFDSML